MTILPTTIGSDEQPLTRGDYAYACARNQSQAHSLLLRAVRESGLSQKELAKRTGIDEATISRTLSRPRNIELNTLSRLLLAAGAGFLRLTTFQPTEAAARQPKVFLASEDFVSSDRDRFVYRSLPNHISSASEKVSVSSHRAAFEQVVFAGTGSGPTMERLNA